MKNHHRSLEALIAELRAIGSRGAMDTEQQQEYTNAASKLMHALKVRDREMIEKVINEIARLFLRDID